VPQIGTTGSRTYPDPTAGCAQIDAPRQLWLPAKRSAKAELGDDDAMTDLVAVTDWVARYEGAWRSPGTDALDELFTENVSYSPSPWALPVEGLEPLPRFWDAARRGPDEGFDMGSEVVAIDGRVAVVRVAVHYDDGQRWRDLWLLNFDEAGRCQHFEEWPFAPGQPDGHEEDR
jgi:hypothetical protein